MALLYPHFHCLDFMKLKMFWSWIVDLNIGRSGIELEHWKFLIYGFVILYSIHCCSDLNPDVCAFTDIEMKHKVFYVSSILILGQLPSLMLSFLLIDDNCFLPTNFYIHTVLYSWKIAVNTYIHNILYSWKHLHTHSSM